MFKEDNNGFILFPHPNNNIVIGRDSGKTMIYLVSFEKYKEDLSHITIDMPGSFLSDDVVNRPEIDFESSIDSIVDTQRINDEYDQDYFPNINSEDELKRTKSIKLISSICIGWNNKTYEHKRENKFWFATFRDLTNEGRRLYYSIKKLHNNKELRILTFNHI